LLQQAGQKATQAKITITENFMPIMGTLMGKAKDTLGAAGAAAQKAYAANINKGKPT